MLSTVILAKEMYQGITRFLNVLPRQTLNRGRDYFANGRVVALECHRKNQLYAAVVQGSEDYYVTLLFSNRVWTSECSCPMQYDCKHAAATMMALEQAARESQPPAPPPRAPQPPKTPLYQRVVAQLGRELDMAEGQYVRTVQSLFEKSDYQTITEGDLVALGHDFPRFEWTPLQLWRKRPADDYYCWLYIAWELRRRGLSFPGFIGEATDLSLIEAEMIEWEHEKQVKEWREWFDKFARQTDMPENSALDLRMAVGQSEARLQWRTSPNAPFIELKQAHVKLLSEQYSHGTLNLGGDSLQIWNACFQPWHYNSWWSFKYSDSTMRPALKRILRCALAPDRIVTPDGKPLERVAEPLRFHLSPPEPGQPDYRIELTTSDGTQAPPILCTLSGRPTIYLCERQIFTGPPADVLESEQRTIPAAALETEAGLKFLQAIGVGVPEHLAARVQYIPVKVIVVCRLQQCYHGDSNDVRISVTASAAGMASEHFVMNRWEPRGMGKPAKVAKDSLVIYDRSAQRHLPTVLDVLGAKCQGLDWSFRLTKRTVESFAAWVRSMPPEIELELEGELASLREGPITGTLSLDAQETSTDWFDLKVVLNVNDTTLTQEELKLLLNARGGYVRLSNKGWRRLEFNLSPEEDEQLARLGLHATDFGAEPQRFHALQLADDAAKKFLAPDRVEKIQRRVSELKTRVTPDLPLEIRATMRPYQTEGFHFLAYLVTNRFGGVLADDMGLGKTLQTLAWLAWLRQSNGNAPHASLVVCPKSVMDNWRAESERFYPGLRVRLWRGEPASELEAARGSSDLIVLNYAQLRTLSPAVANHSWLATILDEAQYIKNPNSQTAQAARALKADHRLALTGTPIENRLLDLWSILAFAMPGALSHRAHFLRTFNSTTDPLARRRLSARVRPFLLRRTKSQVAKDLPDRVEEDILCEMEGEQRTLYSAELKRARQMLLRLKTNQQLNQERFNILTSLLRLRQICCHPVLVNGKLRNAESAKMSALEDLLDPLLAEGHKVLVFSQFVTMLELLRAKMDEHQWPYFYLAGETENRGELVQRFQSAEGGAVFLISLKAGGFGLNLTAASYVVIFDPWWNPAVENQAIDRTHRIGQSCKVMAYRLLVRDTIEQKIRALQQKKAALAEDVLGEEKFAQALTLDDLRFLFAD